MNFDYEAYEKERDAIREVNELHLAGFEKWLKSSGLSQKTIDRHVSNVEFYINDFLCYYDAEDVQHGCYRVGRFLGDWFIRKAMWSSCTGIRSYAASFKKFYQYMLAVNVIEQKDYDMLCETIKEELPDWLDAMRRYDEMLEIDDYY
jgi:site-specific recombinase XerD